MPSIIEGLFSGRAGIQSHGTAISVLADNIANQNTTGFKSSRADFADLLAGSLGGASSISVGSGSTISAVTQIFSQGTFEFTGRGLDVGVDGNGFFVVEDANGSGQRFFSRAGNFKVDTDGFLLDQNGFRVMGYRSNGAGGLEALNVNERGQGSVDTGEVTISGNLDASAAITAGIPALPGATFAQMQTASQFSTFVDVFDSLGASHTITTYFFKTATLPVATWQAVAVTDGGDVVGGTAGEPSLVGQSTLTFQSDGSRTTPIPDPDFVANATWNNGSSASAIDFSFNPFSQFSAASSIDSISQDGTGSGSVVGFNVEQDGTLFAQLDNGQTSSIGVIALSIFANAEGLKRAGSSLYAESSASGEPVIGIPNTGTFGALEAGALELSTADIAGDFIKLISLQRGFQGSSRIITNIDDLLNEIINLA